MKILKLILLLSANTFSTNAQRTFCRLWNSRSEVVKLSFANQVLRRRKINFSSKINFWHSLASSYPKGPRESSEGNHFHFWILSVHVNNNKWVKLVLDVLQILCLIIIIKAILSLKKFIWKGFDFNLCYVRYAKEEIFFRIFEKLLWQIRLLLCLMTRHFKAFKEINFLWSQEKTILQK